VPYSDLGRGFLSGAGKSAQDLFDTGSERLEAASTAPARDEERVSVAMPAALLLA
jgi:hypothetical protein